MYTGKPSRDQCTGACAAIRNGDALIFSGLEQYLRRVGNSMAGWSEGKLGGGRASYPLLFPGWKTPLTYIPSATVAQAFESIRGNFGVFKMST